MVVLVYVRYLTRLYEACLVKSRNILLMGIFPSLIDWYYADTAAR